MGGTVDGTVTVPSQVVVGPSGNSYMPYVPPMPPTNGATPAPGTGTFPYDGGPANPVPMPKEVPAVPAPAKGPARPLAPDGTLFVSAPITATAILAPQRTPQFAYPAYGEDTRATSFATDQNRTRNGR